MPEPLRFDELVHWITDVQVEHRDDVTWTPVPESVSAEAAARSGESLAVMIRLSFSVSGKSTSGLNDGWFLT